jgi:hypothetical protein
VLPENEAIRQIEQGLGFEPFSTTLAEAQPTLALGKGGYRLYPDFVLQLSWEGRSRRFVVEYVRTGTPKNLRGAVDQARRYVTYERSLLPMVMAPYLRPQAIDLLVSEGVSGIDLSGNGVVIVPGQWFVLRTGARNRYPSSAPIKNVFRGKSSLVTRALLVQGSFGSAAEIAKELEPYRVSSSTISKVLKALEEELLIDRGNGIRVLQANLLLDRLVENYRPPASRSVQRGQLGVSPETLRRMDASALQGDVAYVVLSPESYVILPSSSPNARIYTRSVPGLLNEIELNENSRFPDVEIVETTDPTAFYDRRRRDEYYIASPLQVYLELATGGKREREAGEQMRGDIVDFGYAK